MKISEIIKINFDILDEYKHQFHIPELYEIEVCVGDKRKHDVSKIDMKNLFFSWYFDLKIRDKNS